MTIWTYQAFESHLSGRAGITELERSVTEKLESLGQQAEYAKIAMSNIIGGNINSDLATGAVGNIIGGTARAVVYYPETAINVPPGQPLSGWVKGDVNLIADSADTARYHEEMYQGIAGLLSSLSEAQAARSQIAATACKNGYATVTVWYPAETACVGAGPRACPCIAPE